MIRNSWWKKCFLVHWFEPVNQKSCFLILWFESTNHKNFDYTGSNQWTEKAVSWFFGSKKFLRSFGSWFIFETETVKFNHLFPTICFFANLWPNLKSGELCKKPWLFAQVLLLYWSRRTPMIVRRLGMTVRTSNFYHSFSIPHYILIVTWIR